ncbi:hypothetical protein MJO28_003063 [Puccinia striiformis f. sp. tritici]|uniref:Uncharacterized protein n=2 Tax=Puccinia striiformis f. sp. tritici TaxID=168172 RepID=A0ACC0ETV6_9BASI|nr:hypothetical protein MJO28_003061 [Puccinia striiformis f. sp. tritici]KAI7959272.1 hypothetical protein MJO28_003063 [Puccinia striiformis f. sp. tritici]
MVSSTYLELAKFDLSAVLATGVAWESDHPGAGIISTILLSRMALITRQSQEHWLAFVQIQQAIQEDDLWTAA